MPGQINRIRYHSGQSHTGTTGEKDQKPIRKKCTDVLTDTIFVLKGTSPRPADSVSGKPDGRMHPRMELFL
jgi:hypothetical protein